MAFLRGVGQPRIKQQIGQSVGHVQQNIQRKIRRSGFGFRRKRINTSYQHFGFRGI